MTSVLASESQQSMASNNFNAQLQQLHLERMMRQQQQQQQKQQQNINSYQHVPTPRIVATKTEQTTTKTNNHSSIRNLSPRSPNYQYNNNSSNNNNNQDDEYEADYDEDQRSTSSISTNGSGSGIGYGDFAHKTMKWYPNAKGKRKVGSGDRHQRRAFGHDNDDDYYYDSFALSSGGHHSSGGTSSGTTTNNNSSNNNRGGHFLANHHKHHHHRRYDSKANDFTDDDDADEDNDSERNSFTMPLQHPQRRSSFKNLKQLHAAPHASIVSLKSTAVSNCNNNTSGSNAHMEGGAKGEAIMDNDSTSEDVDDDDLVQIGDEISEMIHASTSTITKKNCSPNQQQRANQRTKGMLYFDDNNLILKS